MSDEAWKGESEDDAGWIPRPSFFPPLTKEQREQVARRHAEAVALGNIVYSTLPLYDPKRACVKCGHAKTRVQFIESGRGYSSEMLKQVGEHPYMEVRCRRCGYAWPERPLDAEAQ